MSDCDTYNRWNESDPEPEEEDFFKEVVANSFKKKERWKRDEQHEQPDQKGDA